MCVCTHIYKISLCSLLIHRNSTLIPTALWYQVSLLVVFKAAGNILFALMHRINGLLKTHVLWPIKKETSIWSLHKLTYNQRPPSSWHRCNLKLWHEHTEPPHSHQRSYFKKEQLTRGSVAPTTHWIIPKVTTVCRSQKGNIPIRASTGQTVPPTSAGNFFYRSYFIVALLVDSCRHWNLPSQKLMLGQHDLLLLLALPPNHAVDAMCSVYIWMSWQGVPKKERSQRRLLLRSLEQDQKGE